MYDYDCDYYGSDEYLEDGYEAGYGSEFYDTFDEVNYNPYIGCDEYDFGYDDEW